LSVSTFENTGEIAESGGVKEYGGEEKFELSEDERSNELPVEELRVKEE